jgi:hypothetical protein
MDLIVVAGSTEPCCQASRAGQGWGCELGRQCAARTQVGARQAWAENQQLCDGVIGWFVTGWAEGRL